jgi:hypothetical protein
MDRCAGLGGFAEVTYRGRYFVDNGNLLAMPAYTLVNLNLHYDPPKGGWWSRFSLYASVQNLFDKTYVGSASVISNSLERGDRIRQPGINPLRHHRLDLCRASPGRSTPASRRGSKDANDERLPAPPLARLQRCLALAFLCRAVLHPVRAVAGDYRDPSICSGRRSRR